MLESLRAEDWTPESAGHLLNRAGFGGTPDEINALHAKGPDGAVAAVLNGDDDTDLFPPPAASEAEDIQALKERAQAMTEAEREIFKKEQGRLEREKMIELRAWWLNRMRWTTFPAREKALLFWHGHWATSVEKVKEPFLMWQQNETLRAFALGSFRRMALGMSRDPAMMRYLDVQQSRREQPNENFAREVMELFTLGEGNYSEADIREAARAFTGYRIDPRTRQFRYDKRGHDDGVKTFFGRTGNFSGDDILGLIFENPQCARFLSRKLWIYYAGSEPSAELEESLAAAYRAADFDTGKFLSVVFRSREFYGPAVFRRQIKSPVQWLVGTCRTLELPLPSAGACEGILRQLGQVPFAPPNVKGWDGGKAWISSSTLLLRYNIASYLVSGRAPGLPAVGGDGQRLLEVALGKIYSGLQTPESACEAASWRLFQTRLPASLNARFIDYLATHGTGDAARRDLLHLMMSTPDYQLT